MLDDGVHDRPPAQPELVSHPRQRTSALDRDCLPLSTFPMFSADIESTQSIAAATGVTAAGTALRLTPELIAGVNTTGASRWSDVSVHALRSTTAPDTATGASPTPTAPVGRNTPDLGSPSEPDPGTQRGRHTRRNRPDSPSSRS